MIDELITSEVIRARNSPYANPIMLVKKKTEDLQLCVDFRELNKITVKDHFPTPLIDAHLVCFKDKKHFFTLDLQNDFHRVRVDESSIQYTAFVAPLRQFE